MNKPHKQLYEHLTFRVEVGVLKELRRIAKRDGVPLLVMVSGALEKLARDRK